MVNLHWLNIAKWQRRASYLQMQRLVMSINPRLHSSETPPAPPRGPHHARKSGHHMNNLLVRAVLDDPESHEIVTFTQRRNLPTFSLDWG